MSALAIWGDAVTAGANSVSEWDYVYSFLTFLGLLPKSIIFASPYLSPWWWNGRHEGLRPVL